MFTAIYDLLWRLARPYVDPRRFDTIYPKAQVWIHAASVGELQVAVPLVPKLSDCVITVTSKNGLAALTKRGVQGYMFPADTPDCIEKAFAQIDPKFILLIESEFWPNFAKKIISENIPFGILNLKISKKLLGRVECLLKKRFWQKAEFIYVQNEATADVLKNLKLTNFEISGNLKLAQTPKIESKFLEDLRQLKNRCGKLISFASLRKGEEKILGPVIKKLMDEMPDLGFLVFPRYLEEVSYFAKSLTTYGCRPVVYPNLEKVTIINQFGLVSTGVSKSLLYFIGGTFIKGIGGHNPVEGARFGVVGVSGPYDYKIRDQSNLYVRVSNTDQTYQTIRSLLLNPKALNDYRMKLECEVSRAETYIEKCCNIVRCFCSEN